MGSVGNGSVDGSGVGSCGNTADSDEDGIGVGGSNEGGGDIFPVGWTKELFYAEFSTI